MAPGRTGRQGRRVTEMDSRFVLPDGAIPNGEVAVLSYLDVDGELCYAVWNDGLLPLSSYLGLLELAKNDLIRDAKEDA